jgi:hypothetical protein
MDRGPDTPVRDVMTGQTLRTASRSRSSTKSPAIWPLPSAAVIRAQSRQAPGRNHSAQRYRRCVPSDGAAAYPANREHQNRTLLVSTTSSAAAGLPATRAFTYNDAQVATEAAFVQYRATSTSIDRSASSGSSGPFGNQTLSPSNQRSCTWPCRPLFDRSRKSRHIRIWLDSRTKPARDRQRRVLAPLQNGGR